jgi:hypothetical protein
LGEAAVDKRRPQWGDASTGVGRHPDAGI